MKLRVGVISWDCSLPPDTYFGYYQTRTLSPRKYRAYTPFYADILDEDKITYHERSVEEYERELMYAIEAGIDYLAYVFYPTQGSKNHTPRDENDCSHKVYELNLARRLHEESELKDRIKIAAIVGAHPFLDEDIAELVTLMSRDYYERVNDKPLLYFFGGIREDIIERIKSACIASGTPTPFTVAMYNDLPEEAPNYEAVDALSAYACDKFSKNITYSDLYAELDRRNRERARHCSFNIPQFTVGWDPSPRIDIPSPWVTYPDEGYIPLANEGELIAGAEALAHFIKNELQASFIGHILTFAWNEFEEGGWLCPTYTEGGNISTDRVRAFKKIVSLWRNILE